MKKSYKIAAAAVVILVLLSSITFYTVSRSPDSRGFSGLVDFDPDEAYVDMQYLCGLGPRVPGSPSAIKGAQYVEQRFNEAGLQNVQIEEYPMTIFDVNSASLSLLTIGLGTTSSKSYRHIDEFVLYQFSGSTNGEERFEIVDVGNGTEQAFQGVNVQGKAVLTTQQCLPRAVDKGAVAVIVQNLRSGEELDYPPYCGGLYGGDDDGNSIPYPDANPGAVVPTCAVSKRVGDEIKSAIDNALGSNFFQRSTVWIQMDFDTVITKGSIHNVIGDIPGSENPDDYVYFVAHRDSTYVGPGAVDDLSGTVTIMELARQMVDIKVGCTIRFISMDAEEKGLLGATEYAKAHEDEVSNNGRLVINYDMNDVNLNRVDTIHLWASNDQHLAMTNTTRDRFADEYPDLFEKYDINITKGGGGPDGAPFMKRGVDGAFAMGEWGSSWEYHTQYDTIEYVNPESWIVSGVIFGTLAVEVSYL